MTKPFDLEKTHPDLIQRRYIVSCLHRNFGEYEIVYSDPSAAHEAATKLKSDGHANVRITPTNRRSPP